MSNQTALLVGGLLLGGLALVYFMGKRTDEQKAVTQPKPRSKTDRTSENIAVVSQWVDFGLGAYRDYRGINRAGGGDMTH